MFNRYAPLVSVLFIVSIFAQVISGITESSKVYAPMYAKFKLITPDHAVLIAGIITLVIVACLEIAIRVLTPYAARTFIHKRFSGADMVISILILILTASTLTIGVLMSFDGSNDVADIVVGDVDLITTNNIDSIHQIKLSEINSRYTQDRKDAESRINNQISSVTAAGSSRIESINTKIKNLRQRESLSGQRFTTSISRLEQQISDIKTSTAEEVSKLTLSLSDELKSLQETRNDNTSKYTSKYENDIAQVNNENDKLKSDNELLKQSTGGGLGILTVIMQLLVIVYIIINEIMNKHSGITTKVEVQQTYFEQNFFVQLYKSIFSYVGYQARKIIIAIQKATPDTPIPVSPPTLIDHAGISQQMVVVQPQKRKNIGYDFYTNSTSETFIAHEPKHENNADKNVEQCFFSLPMKAKTGNLELWQLKQRLKTYKKRLGSHTQKAIKIKKAGKPVPKRTLAAIENNKKWVKEYETKINEYVG